MAPLAPGEAFGVCAPTPRRPALLCAVLPRNPRFTSTLHESEISMTSAPPRRPAAAVLLTVLVIALSVLSPVAPAANAHDSVLLTEPADGEQVDPAPTEIAITFTDAILELGAIVMVVDDDQKNWAEGDMRLEGSQATQPVAAELPDGAYDVRWRVVSADGHPVSGAFAFTVGDVEPEPAATETATPAPNPSSDTDAATAHSEDNADAATGLPLVVVGLIGALIGLAVLALLMVWRARRRRNP
ncbi:copper resistance protein CopC [Cryobacterium sp. TMT3-29-2]|nr:copper resistance protein CopC [Cryobacterium sp. TMT3-29-2]